MSNTHMVSLLGVLAGILVILFILSTMGQTPSAMPSESASVATAVQEKNNNAGHVNSNQAKQKVTLPQAAVQSVTITK